MHLSSSLGRRRRLETSPWIRLLVAALFVVSVAACRSSGGTVLAGVRRTPPLDVGAVQFGSVQRSPALQSTAADATGGVSMRAAPGQLLVVYFGYTSCPDVCPTTLADLRVALGKMGNRAERVTLEMVTVDPKRDSLEVLATYLGHFVDRFVAIRPDATELASAEAAFVASSSVTTNASGEVEVSHTAAVYVVDDRGTVRVEWPFGTGASTMARDLQIVIDQNTRSVP